MDQEPVYVPSTKLVRTCEAVLGAIYDRRQCDTEDYIVARTKAYNDDVVASNNKWYNKLLGRKRLMITPVGMEEIVTAELESGDDAAQAHPLVAIARSYGDLEHQAKDAMLQCRLNDTVLVSSGFVRGVSHLDIPLDFMQREPFGFHPNK